MSNKPPRIEINSEEFMRLFMSCRKNIYLFITTFLREPSDIEEVFQETSVVLWKRFTEFRRDGDFKSWAFGIARLQVFRKFRERKRVGMPFNEELIDLLAVERESRLDLLDVRREILKTCMNKLNNRDRELINRCYSSKHRIKDVAAEMAKSMSSIYQSLTRIRKLLHNCITKTLAIQEGLMQ